MSFEKILRVACGVPSILLIPAHTTTDIPHSLRTRTLDVACPFQLGLFLNLYGLHISVKDRLYEFQAMLDHILRSQNYRRMARGCIGSKEGEEVREAIESSSHVHLRPAAFFEHIMKLYSVTSGDIERVEPFRRLEAVGEDYHISRECNLMRGC